MRRITIILLTMLTITAYGQTDKEKAYDLGMKAIKEMEAGKIKDAIELLEQSKELDPENIDYPYEIAYAHYLDKSYKDAIKILKGLTKHDKVNDRIYQMLGNCYDMEKNPAKAIETYETGLKLFPNSGILYLERGNMELVKEDYNKALDYYERGIEVQPVFSSNYYWAAKIYMSSTEEVWGLLYGEIFMNLERNSNRTAEISKLLYDTYKSQIIFTSDTSMTVSFCQQMTMNFTEISQDKEMKLPFCMIYEPTLLMSVALAKSIDINSLDDIRTSFVENYYKMGHNKTHPNILFDYQKQIMDNGHLEAYNHWILMKGDEDTFSIWNGSNKDKWNSFVAWFSENPIEISDTNRFYSGQY
jgi:tetratricopeptide (TPR) repeat protein